MDCMLCFVRYHPGAVIPAFRDICILIFLCMDDASVCHWHIFHDLLLFVLCLLIRYLAGFAGILTSRFLSACLYVFETLQGRACYFPIVVFSMNWGLWVMFNSHDPRQILPRTILPRKDLGAGIVMKDERLPVVSWSRKQAKIQPCSLNYAMSFHTTRQAEWSAAWLTSSWGIKYFFIIIKSLRVENTGEHKDVCPDCRCVLLVIIFFFFFPRMNVKPEKTWKGSRMKHTAYRWKLTEQRCVCGRVAVWMLGHESLHKWWNLCGAKDSLTSVLLFEIRPLLQEP